MKFPRLAAIVCDAFCTNVPGWSAPAAYLTDGDPIAPVQAPFPLPQFARPAFPDRVFNIRDYGASADGTTKNTAAIARAIAACADAGGGHVLVPAVSSSATFAFHLILPGPPRGGVTKARIK